jgi:5'-phosphate synthase pdxT subunit
VVVGILAIQGDYEAHKKRVEELGAAAMLVRRPEELDSLDALIIPGGESSTMLKFLERDGFFEKLKEFVKQKPTFGTCAGAILLAKDVENPPQPSLQAMDIRVRRNAYGRQLQSSITTSDSKLGGRLEMVFIRAPKIESVGKNVEVLATVAGDPVLVRHGKTMAATFHPELTRDTRVHAEFLKLISNGRR